MAVYGMGVIFAPIVGPTPRMDHGQLQLALDFPDQYSIGLLSLVLTSLLIFDPPYLERKKLSEVKIDYIGLGLLSVGLVSCKWCSTRARPKTGLDRTSSSGGRWPRRSA